MGLKSKEKPLEMIPGPDREVLVVQEQGNALFVDGHRSEGTGGSTLLPAKEQDQQGKARHQRPEGDDSDHEPAGSGAGAQDHHRCRGGGDSGGHYGSPPAPPPRIAG